MVPSEENEIALFSSDLQVVETTEEFSALTIESFNLGKVAGIGMILSGTGLIVSLLVLGILSILRTR